MIIALNKLKELINTSQSDSVLELKLQALELLVRKYTNNNFQITSIRSKACIIDNVIKSSYKLPLNIDDTLMISQSEYNNNLYTVSTLVDCNITVKEDVINEENVLITKVVYPIDVVMGVVNMLKWDLDNRDKIGIQSESISRHSVTYFNMDGDNSIIGYPKSLIGFLEPYMKARF